MNPFRTMFQYYLQNINHRGKRHIVRTALKILPFKFIKTHYGPFLRCNPQDRTNIYAISGDYAHRISDHIHTFDQNSVFIDIGANYGLYSFLAADHMKQGHVFSFEPNPFIYRFFLDALFYNKARNIIPFHCAIGEQDSLMNLSFSQKHSGVSCLESSGTDTEAAHDKFSVPVFNVARWAFLNNAIDAHVSIHIKIDVEGYEFSIVKLLRDADWFKQVQSLVIEIDDQNMRKFGMSADAIYEILEQEKFKPTFGLDTQAHYDEIFVRLTDS